MLLFIKEKKRSISPYLCPFINHTTCVFSSRKRRTHTMCVFTILPNLLRPIQQPNQFRLFFSHPELDSGSHLLPVRPEPVEGLNGLCFRMSAATPPQPSPHRSLPPYLRQYPLHILPRQPGRHPFDDPLLHYLLEPF